PAAATRSRKPLVRPAQCSPASTREAMTAGSAAISATDWHASSGSAFWSWEHLKKRPTRKGAFFSTAFKNSQRRSVICWSARRKRSESWVVFDLEYASSKLGPQVTHPGPGVLKGRLRSDLMDFI